MVCGGRKVRINIHIHVNKGWEVMSKVNKKEGLLEVFEKIVILTICE